MAERAKGTSFTAKSLFEGLSGAQLTAGALAAVTSMLLSAQIGIAGSVIGVAVGSVVSTVASQVYKRFLEQSATKLRGMRDSDEESSTGGVGDAEGLEGLEAVPFGTEKDGTASTEEDVRADGPKAGQTEQTEFAGGSMRSVDQLASGRVIAGGVPGRATATPHLGDKSLAGDITAQHVREKREHDKRMQRGVIAVSIVFRTRRGGGERGICHADHARPGSWREASGDRAGGSGEPGFGRAARCPGGQAARGRF